MRLPLVLLAILLAGCTSTPSAIEGPPLEAADATAGGAASGIEPTVLEGSTLVGAGFASPVFSGCEGHNLGTHPPGQAYPLWKYDVPAGATTADLLVAASGTLVTGLRLCVYGLAAGVHSVAGLPPLEMEIPFAGEESVVVAVHAANEPAGAVATVDVTVTVTPVA